MIEQYKNVITLGDSAEVLRLLPDNSVDAVVTDPPYGLSKEPNIREVLEKWLAGEDYEHRGSGFMGKTWDSFVPGPAIWREVFRVLKPGGYILCFAGTRTQDLMTVSLRLAGFEVRDVIEWLYFSGFPKSMDVGKAFDKRAGVEREVIGTGQCGGTGNSYNGVHAGRSKDFLKGDFDITAPATDLARQWDGWGTALKPAHEPIIVARKPLAGTVVATVEQFGTGAINIDGCRISISPTDDALRVRNNTATIGGKGIYQGGEGVGTSSSPEGRFPANIVTTDEDVFFSPYSNITPQDLSKKASKKDRGSDWKGDPISGEEKTTDDGRNKPIDNPFLRGETMRVNSHPTVKPLALMRWLCRLVTPPGGVILEPFAGSGTTPAAARAEGFDYIAIEREPEYAGIAAARTGSEISKTIDEGEKL